MDYSVNNLSRLYFSLLLVAYLVFIGIASFYFTGDVASVDAALDRAFFGGRGFRFNLHNLRDISTNILLYMPLGFGVVMFVACNKKPTLFSLHLGWGLLLSILVETIQAFIGRFSDFTDVISNGTGYVMGYMIGQMSIGFFALRPSSLLGMIPADNNDRLNNISGIRFVYLSVAFISNLLPLNITVSLQDIYSKLTAVDGALPRLILNPLYHLHNSLENLQYLVLNLLIFLPLAFLSSHIQIRRHQPTVFLPAWHCLLFGVVLESSNVFIGSGRTDVLIPLLGFFVGGIVAYLMARFSRADLKLNSKLNRHYLFLSSILLYAFLLLAISLSPYEFEISLIAIRAKLINSSNFIPFMAHFSSRSVAAAVDIVRETLLYAPLGALLALGLRASPRHFSAATTLGLAALLGGSYAITMELLQLTVVGRYVDLTDCLLATLGSVGGAVISPLFSTVSISSTGRTKSGEEFPP